MIHVLTSSIVLFHETCFGSGDQDSVIPLTGSRTLVQNLAHDMGLKTTTPYRVWFEGQQVTIQHTGFN